MSDIKEYDVASEDSADEKDWEAAKAFFENLKTQKPRPVRNLLKTKRWSWIVALGILVACPSALFIWRGRCCVVLLCLAVCLL